jgi:uncharacterized OsmC-like protein
MSISPKEEPAGNSGPSKKKSEEPGQFSISLDCIRDFEFRISFDDTQYPDITTDEPAPVGSDKGPNPSRLLAAAVGGCLSASLLFSARKLRLNTAGLHTKVRVRQTRNEKGRLRIGKIEVEISPDIVEPDEKKLQRCLELFEDFCVVTQSVRNGIDVSVNVTS